MARIPDVGVFLIYSSLVVIYGLFSWWLCGLWYRATGASKSLLLALLFLTLIMAIDNIFWLFGTVAYVNPPLPGVRQFMLTYNLWAVEKILWGVAGILVWRRLRGNNA